MEVKALVLEGRVVRLEPLSREHAADLLAVADPELFRYAIAVLDEWTTKGFERYIEEALSTPGRIPFAVVLRATDKAIGTTSYLDIRPAHRGLEIGYTWYAIAHQGTQVNPESKYLLLRLAFEELGAIRVQLKTDGRNLHSQRAIIKLGAKGEGVLRKHLILPDGYVRDTAFFSITDDEWPQVKSNLEARLGYES